MFNSLRIESAEVSIRELHRKVDELANLVKGYEIYLRKGDPFVNEITEEIHRPGLVDFQRAILDHLGLELEWIDSRVVAKPK